MAGSDKIERLLNLVSLLLDTRRPLSVNEIREKIPSYGDHSDDAFHRMFERDKNDVRDLGFVIDQEDIDAWGETGYRIRRSQALLDDPGFRPDELAALSLAAQAWGGGADGSLGVPHGPWEGEPEGTARVAFSPDTAWWAERRTGARRVQETEDGWVTLEMPVAAEMDSFAGWVAGFADAAVALEPPELRDAVIARLRALAGRETGHAG